MLAFRNDDFSELDGFPLAWRWTDPKFNLLTAAEAAQIHPLRAPGAVALDAFLRKLMEPVPLRIVGTTGEVLCEMVRSGAAVSCDSSQSVESTRDWLNAELPSGNADICVSWSESMAVITKLSLFVQYWDDFCYSLSDNVAVIPFECDRILYYHNEEMFFIWKPAKAAAIEWGDRSADIE
jgi:hypothetical protein